VAPTDVLAYIDDDAVITDTWPSAMEMAWSKATPDVAAIGGPIRPAFLAPRPAWLSDGLLGSLSIVDHGSAPLALVGTNGFLYTANLSFLARHALGAGGFNPALGPLGRATGFGDDIDIQVRLLRLGLRILYEPDAAVFHRIPSERLHRRALLGRHYAQGRYQARATVGPQVTSATLGMLVGLTRAARYACVRRPAVAMDHLSYGSQCVGVLRELVHERATAGRHTRLPIQELAPVANPPRRPERDDGTAPTRIDKTGR
jgi:hypothetical protein